MKRITVILVASLMLAIGAMAQSGHSVSLTWTASADAPANPTLAYNVYRANADCSTPIMPTFIKQTSTPVSGVSYTDPGVSVGNSYCYKARSFLNSLESADSNTANAVILPAPPTLNPAVVK